MNVESPVNITEPVIENPKEIIMPQDDEDNILRCLKIPRRKYYL